MSSNSESPPGPEEAAPQAPALVSTLPALRHGAQSHTSWVTHEAPHSGNSSPLVALRPFREELRGLGHLQLKPNLFRGSKEVMI